MQNIPSFVVAGTSSGSGKTTISLGLMAAFTDAGYRVQPFKCGPDFIDPGLHQIITGRVSRNLDLWMSGESFVHSCFRNNCQEADLAIVEGVMGMFDGGTASSGALARFLGLPVILVLDVRSMAESAAAIVKGFETLQPETVLAGVILNRIASPRHLQLVRDAINQHCSARVLGYLPRTKEFSIPSRHLGLLTSDDAPLGDDAVQLLSQTVQDYIDLEGLLALCRGKLVSDQALLAGPDSRKPSCTVAVARDKAFCFYYEDNFDLLRAAGARLVFFSPLNDPCLPAGIDAVYLGGGYPELYAAQLSGNSTMLADLRSWCDQAKPVYAECGGFMYLTQGIYDTDNCYRPMVGIFPVAARMQLHRASLGYREITTTSASCFGPIGTTLRGHEFHYSTIDEMAPGITRVYQTSDGSTVGYGYKKTIGGYVHLHFGWNNDAVTAFINYCRD